MLRFEELLRLGGVRGAGAGPHDHQPGGGGQAADGQDHLSGRNPFPEAYGISGRARLFEVVQKVKEVNLRRQRQAPGRRFTGASWHDRSVQENPSLALDYLVAPPQNGPLYRLEHKDLQGLPEIHCAGGHLPLQHRRGVHGRDQLPGHLQNDGPGA